MSFETKTVHELVQIAAAGGGFILDAKFRTTNDLVKIAAAGSVHNARITFKGLKNRTTLELLQIAGAGKGCVVFDE